MYYSVIPVLEHVIACNGSCLFGCADSCGWCPGICASLTSLLTTALTAAGIYTTVDAPCSDLIGSGTLVRMSMMRTVRKERFGKFIQQCH